MGTVRKRILFGFLSIFLLSILAVPVAATDNPAGTKLENTTLTGGASSNYGWIVNTSDDRYGIYSPGFGLYNAAFSFPNGWVETYGQLRPRHVRDRRLFQR